MNLTSAQEKVREFMLAASQPVASRPAMPPLPTLHTAIHLIKEEFEELREAAFLTGNLTDLYDASVDLIYTVLWLMNAAGLPADAGFSEVHRSNMTKFIDGHLDEGGKWRKGPSYEPPDLLTIIDEILMQARKNS